jgi:hypothetical protein
MNDPHHTWNDGPIIISEKQPCGCHVRLEQIELCERGKGLRKSVDGWYKLYNAQKDTPVDESVKRAHLVSFEAHRKAYVRHLETGKYWVL